MDLELKKLKERQYQEEEAKRDAEMAKKIKAKQDGIEYDSELTPEQLKKKEAKRQKELEDARQEIIAAREAKLKEQQEQREAAQGDSLHDEYLASQLAYESGQNEEAGALLDPNDVKRGPKAQATIVE